MRHLKYKTTSIYIAQDSTIVTFGVPCGTTKLFLCFMPYSIARTSTIALLIDEPIWVGNILFIHLTNSAVEGKVVEFNRIASSILMRVVLNFLSLIYSGNRSHNHCSNALVRTRETVSVQFCAQVPTPETRVAGSMGELRGPLIVGPFMIVSSMFWVPIFPSHCR